MGLGNNRDYTTHDRNIRRRFAVVKARSEELKAQGIENASTQAMDELMTGKLAKQLKSWVDPILVHKRAMKLKNKAGK